MSRPRRIMIVDDDPVILLNLTAYLEDEGFGVLPASTPQMALERLAEAEVPDLVVVDIRMPGMNGEELILKVHRRLPGLRFIIHTGSSDYSPPPELREIGVGPQDVLFKPLADLRSLVEAIDRLLKEKDVHEEA